MSNQVETNGENSQFDTMDKEGDKKLNQNDEPGRLSNNPPNTERASPVSNSVEIVNPRSNDAETSSERNKGKVSKEEDEQSVKSSKHSFSRASFSLSTNRYSESEGKQSEQHSEEMLKQLQESRQLAVDKETEISILESKVRSMESQITAKHTKIEQLEEDVQLLKDQNWMNEKTIAKLELEAQGMRSMSVKVGDLEDEKSKHRENYRSQLLELEATRRRCNHYKIAVESMEKKLRDVLEENTEMKNLRDEVKTLKNLGTIKERENLQMKSALTMLEVWFNDFERMEKQDFFEVKKRAVESVVYPEGTKREDVDKYDMFFHREKLRKEEEVNQKKHQPLYIPGMGKKRSGNDDDSDAASGTKRSGSQFGGGLGIQSYLDLGTIPTDTDFMVVDHIREIVSPEDNFLLNHIKVGMRVQVRMDQLMLPQTKNKNVPVADSLDVVSARHLPSVNTIHTPSRLRKSRVLTAKITTNLQEQLGNRPSGTMSAMDLSKLVTKAVETITPKEPNYLTQSGIVKFIGLLDMPNPTARVFAGVKMDDRIGYSNGTFFGKRYFFAPEGHGVFVALTDIFAILNVRDYSYIPMARLFRKMRKENQRKGV